MKQTNQRIMPFPEDEAANRSSKPAIFDLVGIEAENPTEENFGFYLLVLGQVRGVGIHTIKSVLRQYGHPLMALRDNADNLLKNLKEERVKDSENILETLRNDQRKLLENAMKVQDRLQAQSIKVLSCYADEFPRQLVSISDGPLWLFVQGQTKSLNAPLIGIVGTRQPSENAKHTTSVLARVIASQGWGIVSGLAEGIDNIAHRMGVIYAIPQVAVLGTGIDVIFPATTKNTRAELIEAGGAVVSEYLPGNNYNKAQFVERNRIQAALSLALCPVESRLQSGTAHTLSFAEKYKRPLFGVQTMTPSSQNELLSLLKQHGHPIFALDSEANQNTLIAWLHTIIKEEDWPKSDPSLNRTKLFRQMLRRLDELLKYVPMSDDDERWLHTEITRRFNSQNSNIEDISNGN